MNLKFYRKRLLVRFLLLRAILILENIKILFYDSLSLNNLFSFNTHSN